MNNKYKCGSDVIICELIQLFGQKTSEPFHLSKAHRAISLWLGRAMRGLARHGSITHERRLNTQVTSAPNNYHTRIFSALTLTVRAFVVCCMTVTENIQIPGTRSRGSAFKSQHPNAFWKYVLCTSSQRCVDVQPQNTTLFLHTQQ